MKIVHFPHPALTTPSVDVTEFDESLQEIAENMIEVMNQNGGIGLAANQVNILKRIVVMNCNSKEGSEPIVLINPKITNTHNANQSYKEGCLSFPSLFVDVIRPEKVFVEWQNTKGEQQSRTFSNLEAVCIQHEIDHLDGINFIDRLGKTKRQMSLLKYSKSKK